MMKTYRKLAAVVPLLLIHLLTLQVGDAKHDHTNISTVRNDPGIVLEEIIIAGSGNNTRVITNAVAEDASQLDDEILSLLSKRETRRGERTDLDQDAVQSHTIANEEDDLEIMSRVIAKYEPQRLTSRKTKRKIVDSSNGTRGIHGKVAEPITDLERAYAEVLQNISRRTPELSINNADVKLNSYLSQVAKQLKQADVPKVIIRPATNKGAEKSRSDFSLTLPALNKKSKRLPKKYLHLNRTASRVLSAEDSESGEKFVGGKASGTPTFKVFNGKAKSKSAFGPTSNVYSGPANKSNSRRKWNIEESIRDIDRFIAQLNNSNLIDGKNLKSLNVSNDAVKLLPRYNVPRPFSALQSPTKFVKNTDSSYRKSSSSPTGFNHQHQIARSSANVLPLVLPTDLFTPPPTRRYVPIKRVNHLEGNPTTDVSTETSPTSPIGERTTLANYDALYTTIIGTTRSPLVAVNSQQNHGSPDYYAVTDNPTERSVTRTNFAATYTPGQTSASYTVERQRDSPGTNGDVSSRVAGYDDDERLNLNENSGVAHYNNLADLYSINVHNVFNTPKAIAQDFKQPVQLSQQQVSTLPYATLKPVTPTSLKIRPITSAQSTPYYDSRLGVSQGGQYSANGDKNDEINEQSRGEDKIGKVDNDNNENYETQVNRETYKVYETPNKQREKKSRGEKEEEENRYLQQSRNYEFESKDKRNKYDKNDNSSSKNDGKHEKHEDVRYENNDDEEEAEESEEDEHVGIEISKDKGSTVPRHRYKYEYDTDHDNSDEKQHDSPRYNHKKYNNPKDRHQDKHDYEDNNEYQFSRPKYFKSLYNDKDRFDKKKLISDKRYKKDRQDRKYKEIEEESVTEDSEDKPIFKDLGIYRSEERDDEQSSREENAREKHEPNPTHTSEKYHPRPEDDRRDYSQRDNENRDNDKEDAERDHVHGETQEHAHKHEEHHGKKDGDHHFEKGEGAEHEEEHHGHEGEKGEKGYKVWDEHEKAEKGHHDKEQASKHYDEKSGEEKKHDEEGGYHEEHNHGESGKKTSEFGEEGKHKKGHTTHGEHSVHKKDEYEKKTEFFDEFHEDGDVEKHGGHHHDHEAKKGGHKKKGHHDGANHEDKYGKEEKYEKGGHHHEHKGHKVDEGDDHHYDHDHKYGKKEGHEHGKKWSFKKGDGGGDAGGDHKHDR